MSQPEQRPSEHLLRRRITADRNVQAAVSTLWESGPRAVPIVPMHPEHPAVLQLSRPLHGLRTAFDSPDVGAGLTPAR